MGVHFNWFSIPGQFSYRFSFSRMRDFFSLHFRRLITSYFLDLDWIGVDPECVFQRVLQSSALPEILDPFPEVWQTLWRWQHASDNMLVTICKSLEKLPYKGIIQKNRNPGGNTFSWYPHLYNTNEAREKYVGFPSAPIKLLCFVLPE